MVVVLRPFQQEAVDKLSKPKITSRLIGDEMGLGKTVEAMALDKKDRLAHYAEHGRPNAALKTLIIARPSALDHWKEWVLNFAPNARVEVINPKNRPAFVRALKDPTVHYYLMHWEALRLIPELQKTAWFHIIADEVHRIKNRKAQVTRALKAIKNVQKKTGLSGTPADDKPEDFWSVLNWIWPKYYTSYWKFVGHYCMYDNVTIYGKDGVERTMKKFVGVQNAKSLHKEIDPWFIRRLKADVLEELPDKDYDRIWVDLDPKQRRAYDEMKNDMIAWVEQQDQTKPLAAPAVIAQLIRLQQFALGYTQHRVTWHKRRNENRTDWIRDKSGEPILFPMDHWDLVEPSSKIDAMMGIIMEDPTRQYVVFSQFKTAINMAVARLQKAGISAIGFHGDVAQTDRGRLVNDFQEGKYNVFASTIATGGESITLTSASTEIFLDRSWKPVQNAQAEDRCHRIGQKNAVQIIDLMARDTVDLGRHQRIEQKWDFLKQILGDK